MSMRAPTGTTATTNLTSKITVSWNAVSGASSYSLYRSTTDNSGSATLFASGLTGTSYDDSSVSDFTFYFYWLKAVGGAGTSAFSGMASGWKDAAAPGTPGSVNATNNQVQQVTVSWSAASGALGYYVYRNTSNTTSGATLIGGTSGTSFVDSSGTTLATYYYFVKAWNFTADGSFSASHSGVALNPVPAAPTGLSGSTDEVGQISIDFTPSTYATSFSIYRNTSNTTSGATLIAGSFFYHPYVDSSGLSSGVTYWYFLKATNATGTSGFSSGVSGAILVAPVAPGAAYPNQFNVSTNLYRHVTIDWTASPGADTYDIYRGPTTNPLDATLLASGLTSPSYDDTSVTDSTPMYYWAKAINAAGSSGFGPSSAVYGYGLAPAQPPAPSCSTSYAHKIVVTFAASTGADTGVDYLQIWRSDTNSFGTATLIADSLTPPAYGYTTTYDDVEDLPLDTDYFYWIVAVNNCGSSPPSTSGTGREQTPGTPPAPYFCDSYRFGSSPTHWVRQWFQSTQAGTDGYYLSLSDNMDPEDASATFLDVGFIYGPSPTFTPIQYDIIDTGAGIGKYIAVRAYNRGGNSAWSNSALTHDI